MHSFGRLKIRDRRDREYPVTAVLRKRAPRRRRYWSDHYWWGDQLDAPHCVGFAWAHWLEDGPVRHPGRSPAVHPAGVYRLAQLLDEWPGEDYDGTSVRAGAKVLQALGFVKSYWWAQTADQVAQAVLQRGPVVVGTEWYEGMTRAAGGRLELSGELQGGHAWLINGANLDTAIFRLKNSWGRRWGNQGRATIRFADLDRLLRAGGEACLAEEIRLG